ncbi:MAG TPA: hypothetical protein VNY75_04975, partial [Rhizomicrobium sp.]|nr:hypothetical protein [Rhizomicrobium sp.]
DGRTRQAARALEEEGGSVKLLVTPGYGWGWFRKDGSAVDVPPAFELNVEIIEPGEPFMTALGRADGGHPLSGMWVLLAQRHKPADGQCSVYVFAEKPIVPKIPEPLTQEPNLTGFASTENSN